MSVTERDHAVFKMALTLAHNLCVQRSDRHNADDETSEAKTAHQCAVLIGTWLDASDEQIAEMMREVGIGSLGDSGTANTAIDTIADLEQEARLMRARMERLEEENERLQEELETERLRLAACGTAALGYFDGCIDEYRSASLNDVLRLREAHEWQKKLSEEGLRQIENLESLLRQALDFCEFVWRDVAMNDHDAFERLEQIIAAIRQHLEGGV